MYYPLLAHSEFYFPLLTQRRHFHGGCFRPCGRKERGREDSEPPDPSDPSTELRLHVLALSAGNIVPDRLQNQKFV